MVRSYCSSLSHLRSSDKRDPGDDIPGTDQWHCRVLKRGCLIARLATIADRSFILVCCRCKRYW
jgi:hypothetical protein